jgi:hypothetical protein
MLKGVEKKSKKIQVLKTQTSHEDIPFDNLMKALLAVPHKKKKKEKRSKKEKK